MAHTIRDKKKLINRVHRLKGQLDAVEKALEIEGDPTLVLNLIAACRGGVNSLMFEVLEGHIRFHVIDPDRHPTSPRSKAAQELIDVLRSRFR